MFKILVKPRLSSHKTIKRYQSTGSFGKATPLKGLKYLKGNNVDLSLRNKVYLIEMWATWCPPCLNTIPHLTSVAQKFKNDLQVIGITNETDEEKVKGFVAKMGDKMNYTVALDTTGDFIQNYAVKYGVNSIPHAFLVDKNGDIVWHNHPQDVSMEPAIEKAISEK